MALENGLDDRYITSSDLQQYFVNKANGEANADGTIRFWVDTNRTTPKTVYELVQDSNTSTYSYAPLDNPLPLSGVGTVVNASGDDIPIYWYPYDEFGNLELYYVQVFDANGNLQFTREAWPYPLIEGGNDNPTQSSLGIVNQLTNPQFTKVLFTQGSSLSIPIASAGSSSVTIAPGWTLNITATGAATVTVSQVAVSGSSVLPNNPPFTLTVTGSSTISDLSLSQKLNNNPDWAAPSTSAATNGYIASSILLGPGTGVIMQYSTSNGSPAQEILDETNNTPGWVQFSATVQLDAASNPDDGITGYDQIVINFSNPSGTSQISNVQVLSVTSDVSGIPFEQSTANRQLDQMFNYYKGGLDFKSVSSYLIGWDFPLNPAQFLGSNLSAFATGDDTSNYVWDQTILFQTTNSGVVIGRNPSGAIIATAAASGQVALIQYLPEATARELLSSELSVMLSTHSLAGISGTISLWYTTDADLPDMSSNKSLIAELDPNGKPETFNGNWTEITRNGLGDATFTSPVAVNNNYFNIGFNGWNTQGNGAITATYFAIVVGTAALATTDNIVIQSVSLVPGSVPTIPARQSSAAVLHDCQQFYWSTFPAGVVPGTQQGKTNAVVYRSVESGLNQYIVSFSLPVSMYYNGSSTVTFYNPVNNNANWYNDTRAADSGVGTVSYPNFTSIVNLQNPQVSGDLINNTMLVHVAIDNRLGF